jgi:SAM-dependent methyltransferase
MSQGSDKLYYRKDEARQFPRRRDEIIRLADLKPADHVLDVGCAEGWMTLHLATLVEHAHGFDKSAVRIAEARRLAAERGIENATFEVASVIDYPVGPLSYDMTLFSGVWGAPGVGFRELEQLLKLTRRQLVARIQLVQQPERALQIYDLCDRNGFDALFFPTKFVVATRRGTDVRVPELPSIALVPTARLPDDPIVGAAQKIAS